MINQFVKKALLPLIGVCGLVGLMPAAIAQSYPDRPITLIVPFPPGGATDTIGRLFATKMGERLGKNIVVENKPGAGTIIGAGIAAKAPADGYTVFVSTGTTFTLNPAIQSKLPYDPIKSFEPIGMVAKAGLVLLASNHIPVANVQQFVDFAKAGPGKYTYGSSGTGSTAHFAGEMISGATHTDVKHIPYKGSGPSMTDLIGGHIDFAVDTISAAVPQLKSGKIKAIAVTTAKRSSLMPDVPTFAESGYADANIDAWLAIFTPNGLPPQVKSVLQKTLADVMADPDTSKKLIAAGFEPVYASPAEVTRLINSELPKMRALAHKANITPQ